MKDVIKNSDSKKYLPLDALDKKHAEVGKKMTTCCIDTERVIVTGNALVAVDELVIYQMTDFALQV